MDDAVRKRLEIPEEILSSLESPDTRKALDETTMKNIAEFLNQRHDWQVERIRDLRKRFQERAANEAREDLRELSKLIRQVDGWLFSGGFKPKPKPD